MIRTKRRSKVNNVTQEEAVRKLDETYENKYDHSKVVYKGSEEIIKVICKEHGEFERKYSYYLVGWVCKDCKKEKIKKNKLQALKNRYKEEYDLSKVEYTGESGNIIIGCNTHGYFKKSYGAFLKGDDCSECKKKRRSIEKQKAALLLSEEKFNYKFKYTIDKWGHKEDIIKIVCPDHGDFTSSLADHVVSMGVKIALMKLRKNQ